MRKVTDDQKLKEVRIAINYIQRLKRQNWELINSGFRADIENKLVVLRAAEKMLIANLFKVNVG